MELLAPAGSMEALMAAIGNGADAVYLGGRLFNARQSANNFSIEEIAEAVKYAHLRGVRIYITVNILLADSEFPQVLDYIQQLMKCEVDAIIIQDIGLMYAVKEVFPELPIHASTQMTIHNSYGAKWFSNEGMERVVLARELSLDEIKHIARVSSVELETFVHGALCISYSGQCLFSSMIGGRSGNRGRCAQPCRMTYTLVNEHGKVLTDKEIGEHLLSPKDLNTSELLPKLDEAGITSLKIEGRMKRPEYVATVIRVYRAALNRVISGEKFSISSQDKKDLTQIFNRDFTTGYYLFNPGRNLMSYKRPNNRGTFLGRIVHLDRVRNIIDLKLDDNLRLGDGVEVWVTKGGREGFEIQNFEVEGQKRTEAQAGEIATLYYKGNAYNGDRVFKTADIRLQRLAQESYTANAGRKISIDVDIKMSLGSPINIKLIDEDKNTVEVTGSVPSQIAKKTPTTPEMIKQQVNRIGNTAFKVDKWSINIEPGLMLPVSEINSVRRDAIAQLEEIRLEKFRHYQVNEIIHPNKAIKRLSSSLLRSSGQKRATKLSIAVSDFEGFRAAVTAEPDIIYVGGEQFRKNKVLTKEVLAKIMQTSKEKNIKIVFALPRIWHDHETKYLAERVKVASDVGINAFQISTLAGIPFIKEIQPNAELYADYYFNIFNSFSLSYAVANDIKLATLSPELTLNQLKNIHGLDTFGECLVFGSIPLMISEHCMLGSSVCGRTENTKCNFVCKDGKHYLQDRMKFKFPVITDMVCRMHIFNAKVMNLLPNLNEILQAAPQAIRLDLRIEDADTINEVSKIFSKAMRNINLGIELNTDQLQERLLKYFPQGFTKGHYFRGVLDVEE